MGKGGRDRRKKGLGRKTGVDPRILAAGLFLFSAALYLNTLGHGFVFDDGALILQNAAVTEFRWSQMFGTGSYRPVRTLTYAVNYALGGENPFGYHLFNLLLHALNAVLLLRLLWLWTGASAAALAGALVFAVHPVQTAAVAYVSGRKDLLATGFLLGALALYTHYRRHGGFRILAGSLALAALAMLSKEVALVFPGLLLLVEAFVLAPERDPAFRTRLLGAFKRIPLAVGAAGLLAAAGLAHALFISRATRMSGFWGGDPGANFGTSLKLFAHYLKLVFWPHPLIADYTGQVFPLSTGLAEPATLLGGVILLGFLLLAIWQSGRRPLVSLGMFWFLLSLLPVLQLIPFHELAADHFLYLPMAGTALAVAHFFPAWAPSIGRPTWGALAGLVLICSGLTLQRNEDWKDAQTLWEATYAKAPRSYRANTNLARIYFQSPELRPKALEMTRTALELAPDDPVAGANLGAMQFFLAQEAFNRGELASAQDLVQSAREHLESARRKRPRDGSILSNLGSAENLLASLWERRGNVVLARRSRQSAIRRFEAALEKDGRKEVQAAWYNLASIYLDLHRYSDAASCLERFLSTQPDHPDANLRLGWCRIQLGDASGAVPPLETAIQTRPSPEAFELLAAAYQGLGRRAEAIALCRQGLQLFPGAQSLAHRLDALERAGS